MFCTFLFFSLHKVINHTHPRSASSSPTLHSCHYHHLRQPFTFQNMINPVLLHSHYTSSKHFFFPMKLSTSSIVFQPDQPTFSILLYTHISKALSLYISSVPDAALRCNFEKTRSYKPWFSQFKMHKLSIQNPYPYSNIHNFSIFDMNSGKSTYYNLLISSTIDKNFSTKHVSVWELTSFPFGSAFIGPLCIRSYLQSIQQDQVNKIGI